MLLRGLRLDFPFVIEAEQEDSSSISFLSYINIYVVVLLEGSIEAKSNPSINDRRMMAFLNLSIEEFFCQVL